MAVFGSLNRVLTEIAGVAGLAVNSVYILAVIRDADFLGGREWWLQIDSDPK